MPAQDPASRWQEPIDARPGAGPAIRSTASDLTYELRILGGVMAQGWWSPSPRMRLAVRCDEAGNVYARVIYVPRVPAL